MVLDGLGRQIRWTLSNVVRTSCRCGADFDGERRSGIRPPSSPRGRRRHAWQRLAALVSRPAISCRRSVRDRRRGLSRTADVWTHRAEQRVARDAAVEACEQPTALRAARGCAISDCRRFRGLSGVARHRRPATRHARVDEIALNRGVQARHAPGNAPGMSPARFGGTLHGND